MPNINLNGLVVSAADYKIVLIIPTPSGNKTFPLQTVQEISWSIKKDSELVYAVGSQEPIANKSNGKSYEGRLSLQAGEAFAILALCGLPDMTEINEATLAIASIAPGGIVKTFQSLNINSEDFSTRAKDKDSRIDTNFTALGTAA